MTVQPYRGNIGDLFGIRVYDWSDPNMQAAVREKIWLPSDYEIPYDEMIVMSDGIVAGEAKHFLWRMRVQAENEAVRKVAQARIEAAYEKILGEPYPQ